MAKNKPKKPGFLRLALGHEVVMIAGHFGIDPQQAAKGQVVLAVVEFGGGKVLAAVPPSAFPSLQRAVRDAARIHRMETFADRIKTRWSQFKLFLKNLRGPPEERLRLKRGEHRMIRADAMALGAWKDSDVGRTTIAVIEEGAGSVMILLPDKSLSDFATAAFQAIRLARAVPSTTPGGPIPETVTSVIIPDEIGVIDPKSVSASPDHSVLSITIGGVRLQFSAHIKMWRRIFDVLCKE